MTIDIFRLVTQAQAAYAHAIDNDRLEDWPGFFCDPCSYVVTTADNYAQGLEAGLVFANSHGMLRDRVSALREANIYERHSYRHIIGAPFILEERAAQADTETPFMVARIMRTGETELFATGRYLDTYRVEPAGVSLERRLVVLDSSRIDTLLAIPL